MLFRSARSYKILIRFPPGSGAIGFGLASHWLKNWRESFKPITKCSNHNHVIITFDSHVKNALYDQI